MVTNHPSQIATAATTQTRKFMTRCSNKPAVSTLIGYSHLAVCSNKPAVSTPLGYSHLAVCSNKPAVSTPLGYSHLAACPSKPAVSTPLGNLNGGFHQFSRWEFANS